MGGHCSRSGAVLENVPGSDGERETGAERVHVHGCVPGSALQHHRAQGLARRSRTGFYLKVLEGWSDKNEKVPPCALFCICLKRWRVTSGSHINCFTPSSSTSIWLDIHSGKSQGHCFPQCVTRTGQVILVSKVFKATLTLPENTQPQNSLLMVP